MYQFRIVVPFFVLLSCFSLFQTSPAHAASGLTLTWQNNATNADGIIIQRRLYSSPDTTFAEIWRVLSSVDHYLDTTAAVGQKYCYRVGAYNAAGVNYSNVNCGLIAPPPEDPAPLPGDLDGDGLVTCDDLAIVKASFGKLSGQSGFDPRADTNKDGVINIIDLSYVAQLLSNVSCESTSPLPGDLNSDGIVTCGDLAIVKASFGKLSGQSGFDPRADTNKDGAINIIDLAYVAQRLPANTICP